MRVGIDVTPLVGPPTGVHQHTRHLLDALVARPDIEVRGWLLSARGDRPDLGVPVRRAPVPASIAARLWPRIGWPGRRSLGGVDVVHGTNFLGPPAPSTVLTVHDLTPLRHPELVEPAVAAKAPAIRAAIEGGAWVHTPSEAVAAELRSVVSSDRIRVVHQGLGVPQPSDDGAGRRLAGADRYLLVLGTTERRKAVTRVVRAMHAVPADVRLVIAGPAGNDEAEIQQAIADERIDHRTVRLTDVDATTRDSLLGDATALVLASSYEGFGFTPLEAAAIGTPVVATAVGALPELIGDLVPLADPDSPDLAPLLRAACEDPSMPSAVTDRVRALTWDAHAAAMVDLYRLAAAS